MMLVLRISPHASKVQLFASVHFVLWEILYLLSVFFFFLESEIKFLAFFFRQLRINDTNRFQGEFPYVSPCGREKNYVRCDDVPIVFTGLEKVRGELVLAYNYCGTELALPFQPHKLYMSRSSGRIYHPGPERLHGVGLIKSQMAIDFSHGFQFDEVGIPIHFTFNSTTYRLDNSLKSCLAVLGRKEES